MSKVTLKVVTAAVHAAKTPVPALPVAVVAMRPLALKHTALTLEGIGSMLTAEAMSLNLPPVMYSAFLHPLVSSPHKPGIVCKTQRLPPTTGAALLHLVVPVTPDDGSSLVK